MSTNEKALAKTEIYLAVLDELS